MFRISTDDIIVPSQDIPQGLDRLERILQILIQHKLKLHPKKCQFFLRKLLFLGQYISANGVEANQAKTKTVREWPTPRSQTVLRGFLGLTNYLSQYVQNYAKLAEPLYRLTEKGQFAEDRSY